MNDELIPPPPALPPDLPSDPMPPSGPEGARLPWEERSRLGFVTALVDTMRMIATEPAEAFGRLRQDGDYMSPLLFSGMFSGMLGMDAAASLGGGGFQLGLVTVLFPIFYGIGILIGLAIYHGCLLLVGGVSKSDLGVEGTFKVISYSQLASLGGLVPILGFLIVIVAQVIFLVVGFQKVHGASQGQALAATLLPLLLCCVCVALAVALGFAGALAAVAGAGG